MLTLALGVAFGTFLGRVWAEAAKRYHERKMRRKMHEILARAGFKLIYPIEVVYPPPRASRIAGKSK